MHTLVSSHTARFDAHAYSSLELCICHVCLPSICVCTCVHVCVLQVDAIDAGTMLSLYVLYVAATFYTSRADEPLHADLALHEFPPADGGIGEAAPLHTAPAAAWQRQGLLCCCHTTSCRQHQCCMLVLVAPTCGGACCVVGDLALPALLATVAATVFCCRCP